MKLTQYHKSLIIRAVIILVILVLLVFATRWLKHSDFYQSLRSKTEETIAEVTPPVTVKQDASKYSVPLENYIFERSTDSKQIGRTTILNDSNESMVYSASFPTIGNDAIDQIIFSDVQSVIEAFKTSNAGYVAPDEHSRASLSIDYESYITGDSLVSVVFNIVTITPASGETNYDVHTHSFMLSTSEEITLDKITGTGYADFLNYQVAAYLSSNETLKATMDNSPYKNNYAASPANFGKFAISNSGLVLYFSPDTIAPKEAGVIKISMPPTSILPYLIYDPFKQVELPVTAPVSPEPTIPADADELYQAAIDPAKPMVALTFDDGPRKLTTNKILDTLEKYGCRATFFVLGSRLASDLETTKRAVSLGCDIGNHSYDHTQFSKTSDKKIKKELAKTNKLLADNMQIETKFVRTPYGETQQDVLKSVDYPVILWNVDTEDWRNLDAKKTIKAATKNISDGDIILMHDIYESTADAVAKIVPKLRKQGFQIVTISELFEHKGQSAEAHKYYFNVK